MDRLTQTYNPSGRAGYTAELLERCNYDRAKAAIAVTDKLAAYEDIEERGRLVVLPCKIGQKVYRNARNGHGQIISFDFDYRHIPHFGKTVFLTRAEAEAALTAMEDAL